MNSLVNTIITQLKNNKISRDTAYGLLSNIKRTLKEKDTVAGTGFSPVTGDIAVIGMACRFPGADNVEQFWQNLLAGKEAISEFPGQRCPHELFYSADPSVPDKSYIKVGGFINQLEKFDYTYFNIPPAEAAVIDPQQRLFLEIALHTFQGAGYNRKQLWGTRTGVFVGARMGTYQAGAQQQAGSIKAAVTGNLTNFIAGRVSDFFNLKGPALAVDTACSSALTALHYACCSIHSGECQQALVGGVNLHITPFSYINLSNAQALSHTGKSYVFDKKADGFVPGEGAGAVLLKPLDAALKDGDPIAGVIKGTGLVNDGHTMGITTPDHEGQRAALEGAYRQAGIDPATVTYMEAHGTGTSIGDPIELKALNEFFRKHTQRRAFCAIGSVKTNIGHLDTAAGLAGLIKVMLALRYKRLPPTLNCTQPNPRLDFINSCFYPHTYAREWESTEGPRRAGLSSFGFGGTNCHVVLEESPDRVHVPGVKQKSSYLFTLSAHTVQALGRSMELYLRYLEENPETFPGDLCYSAATGRDPLPVRLGLIVHDLAGLKSKLQPGFPPEQSDPHVFFGKREGRRNPRLVFVFGDSLPAAEQAYRLSEQDSVFKQSLERCIAFINPSLTVSALLSHSGHQKGSVSAVAGIPIPVVAFIVNYALAHYWIHRGIKPAAVTGTGAGLYLAACLAGVFDLEEAFRILHRIHPFERQSDSCPAGDDAVWDSIIYKPVHTPIVCTMTGYIRRKGTLDREYWLDYRQQSGRVSVEYTTALQNSFDDSLKIGECSPGALERVMAALFVKGYDVDFIKHYSGVGYKKIPLPLYPLERKRCWVEQNFTGNSRPQAAMALDIPLAGEQLLLDHVIREQVILPGVCYWDLAIKAGCTHFGRPVCRIREISHKLPMVIASLPDTLVHIVIDGGDPLKFRIVSRQPGSEDMIHAEGQYDFTGLIPRDTIDIEVLKEQAQWVLTDKDEIYSRFKKNDVYYGPAFQSLVKLYGSSAFVLAELKIPAQKQTSFINHPGLLDGALQSIIGMDSGDSVSSSTYVPFFIEEINIYQPPADAGYSIFQLIKGNAGTELLQANIFLTDMEGHIRIFIKGLHFKRLAMERPVLQVNEPEQWLYKPLWINQLKKTEKKRAVTVLLFRHTGSLHDSLAEEIRSHCDTLISVYTAARKKRISSDSYRINADNMKDYAWLYKSLLQNKQVPETLIHLWSFTDTLPQAGDGETRSWEYFCKKQTPGAGSLFYLAREWGLHPKQETAFYVLTSKTFSTTAADGTVALEKTTLAGLTRVIPLEYNQLGCTLIDLPVDGWESSVVKDLLLKEIFNKNTDPVVLLRDESRKVMSMARLESTGKPEPARSIKERGVYLITGGLSGIGLAVANYLARHFSARLILISRKALPHRSDWTAVLADPGADKTLSARVKALSRMEECGAEVLVVKADVADIKQMESCYTTIRARGWSVAGIFHCAGIVKDRFISAKTWEDFISVLRPKVGGAINLNKLFGNGSLDFMILFSSMVSLFGNAGQSDYAAANSFLDAFAHCPGPARTLNWTLWSKVGMGSRADLVKQSRSHGVNPLSPGEGLQALWSAMQAGAEKQILILNNPIEDLFKARPGREGVQPRATGIKTDVEIIPPVPTQISLGIQNPDVSDLQLLIEELLIKQVSNLLCVEPSAVDTDINFMELGLDSVKLVSMTSWLGEQVQCSFYPTLLFEYSSIELLSAYFSREFQELFLAYFKQLYPVGPEKKQAAVKDDSAKTTAIQLHRQQPGLPVKQSGQAAVKDESGKTTAIQLHRQQPGLPVKQSGLAVEKNKFGKIKTNQLPGLQDNEPSKMPGQAAPPSPVLNLPYKKPGNLSVETPAGRGSEIAVIAYSGRFPGAGNTEEYWQSLLTGGNAASSFPRQRLSGLPLDKTIDIDNITGHFLDNIDKFDPLLFKIAPREAPYIDPQQRLMLEIVRELFESAGYNKKRLNNLQVGTFIGAAQVEYRGLWKGQTISPYMGLGNSLCLISNRLSYLFNLQGPSLTVDTACSSSLVSVHLACRSISSGEVDMAVAGGVQLYMAPDTFKIFEAAGMLSPDSRCKTFDRNADGYVRGEGAGAVLLKSLSKAREDGDTIHAVIRGSAVNHDGGYKAGIAAPNPRAQKQVILEALRNARINPETVSYVELHGTGTSLGDPVEMTALTGAYRATTGKNAFCALGSAKSVIGHLEAAAGIAGLIKVILSLKKRQIPPAKYFNQPNPHIDFLHSPFFINDKIKKWSFNSYPNRAAISAFGFGGTNAHLILEEFRDAALPPLTGELPRADMLVLSARTESALKQRITDFIRFLDAGSPPSLAALCYSTNTGKEALDCRLVLLADSLEQLRDRLDIVHLKGAGPAAHPYGIFYGNQPVQNKRMAFLLKTERDTLAVFQQQLSRLEELTGFRKCLQLLETVHGFYLKKTPQHPVLLFAAFYGLAKMWMELGCTPSLIIGDEIGERVGLVLNGALPLEKALADCLEQTDNRAGVSSASALQSERKRLLVLRTEYVEQWQQALRNKKIDILITIQRVEEGCEPAQALLVDIRDLQKSLLHLAGCLYAGGIDISFTPLYRDLKLKRIPVPAYCFRRRRFWLNSQDAGSQTLPGTKDTGHKEIVAPVVSGRTDRVKNGKKGAHREPGMVRHLLDIISAVLKLEPQDIHIKTNIADLGLDSLLIQDILVKLEQLLGQAIEPSLFFEFSTLDAMAAYLHDKFPLARTLPPEKQRKQKKIITTPGVETDFKTSRIEKISAISPEADRELKNRRMAVLQKLARQEIHRDAAFKELKDLGV